MRQRESKIFAEILNRLREGKLRMILPKLKNDVLMSVTAGSHIA